MPTKQTTTTFPINLAVLMGTVTSPLVSRELPDGTVMSTFDISTHLMAGRVSVPVSIEGEPSVVLVGSDVCVTGYVRRRFFRSGSAVTSRTEVVAHNVIPMRRMAQVRKTVERDLQDLLEILDR